jgi:hypothetical protein
MPMPSNVRKINRNTKVGENPAMKLQTEIPENRDHQWGFAPDPIGEQTRTDGPHQPHPQSQRKDATSVVGTWNSSAIGLIISRNTVKSKASSVQPSHAAHQAYHWSLVGSRHQGMFLTVSTAVILPPPCI